MARLIRRGFQALSGDQSALDVEGVPVDLEEKNAWDAVGKAELALRKLVCLKYNSRWKEQADDRIRKILGEDASKSIEKMQQKESSQYPLSPTPGKPDLLDYCYLGQLVTLVLSAEAWELFKHLFKDKHQLEEIVKCIMPVRNDRDHFRPVPVKELKRCQIASDDLMVILSKEHVSGGP